MIHVDRNRVPRPAILALKKGSSWMHPDRIDGGGSMGAYVFPLFTR